MFVSLRQCKIERAFLGIAGQNVDIPTPLRDKWNIHHERGVLVIGVEPSGPARDAGVEEGDVLLELAGEPIGDVDGLHQMLTPVRIGLPSPLSLLRRGALKTLTVVPRAR